MYSIKYGTKTITYIIERKPTRKNTYINVDRDGVLVKTNEYTSKQEIEHFIIKKSAWILKNVQLYKAKVFETEICTGARLYYLGKSYYVELLREERRNIEVRFTHSRFIIIAPTNTTQVALYQAVDKFYKEKASAKILPMVERWADLMNVSPEHVSFRKANKRWGSCSPTDRISFNYHLVKIPTSLIEYVVVHELVHICCKNHSKEFWTLVGEYMPDYKEKEAKIKRFEKLI